MISDTIDLLFYFYYILLIIRIFLTWIPSIIWGQQPFAWMRSVTDPLLNIFREIIPPYGGVLDISPILAIFLLRIMQALIVGTLNGMGL